MVAPIIDDVRVGVVLRLQSIAKRFDPGTESFEAADHAATFALSARRSSQDAGALFFRAWRDAKRVLRRRRRILVDPLTPDSALGGRIAEGSVPSMVVREDSSTSAITNDLTAQLRRAVEGLGPLALDCLDGMLRDESVEEAAARLHVSPRTVKRLRAQIRAAASRVLLPRAA
jgi:hypothetical protein